VKQFGIILTLALGILLAPLTADAQRPGKIPRIGFLGSRSPSDMAPQVEVFRQALREVGHVEGQNIAIEYRYAEGKSDRSPSLAADLVRLKLDVIVTTGTLPTLAARNATRTIPIVMLGVGDPIGSGLIASLARPGGNVTGLSLFAGVEILGKSLELLKEAIPTASRVAVLVNPSNPVVHRQQLGAISVAAERLKLELQILTASGPSEFESAFRSATQKRANALDVVPETLFFMHQKQIVDLAAKTRLPAIYGSRESVEAGGLMAYGPSLPEQFRRAATYVDKILKGAKPADLPVEQPTKFELVVNLTAAKALGLTIPPSVLARADEIIQ